MPRLLATLTFITFLAISPCTPPKPLYPNTSDALNHFLAAQSFFAKDDFGSAANELLKALEADQLPPDLAAWAHADLGQILDLTGQSDRALREYKQVLQYPSDEAERPKAIAAQRLNEGATPSEASLHHLFGPYVPNVKSARPRLKVPAEYSKDARIAQLEGTVGFFATVQPDGAVQDLRLSKPLALGLDEAALVAAKRWSFAPLTPEETATPVSVLIEIDFLVPTKRSRWHLVGVSFNPPDGASPPHFVSAPYPPGIGVSNTGRDEAAFVDYTKRQALTTISFDVDPSGRPTNLVVQRTTYPTWGSEAISFVKNWRFTPGTKDGAAVTTPCTIDLVWGERQFTHLSILHAQQVADLLAQQAAFRK